MTARFRLAPGHKKALLISASAVGAAIWITSVRANRGSEKSDIDEVFLALSIVAALVLWAIVVVVVAVWLPRLRLDDQGLRWTTGYRPGWRGPISPSEVISLRAGAVTRSGGYGLAGAFLGRAVVQSIRADRGSILFLRSDAGSNLRRLKYMQVPGKQPRDAESYLFIREPVLDSNPDFARAFRKWIHSS